MSDYPIQLSNKIDIVDIKADVLVILHSLKVDDMYKMENCVEDLQNIIMKLGTIEQPLKLMEKQ